MNRFVILMTEGYDMYYPTVPHAFETRLTKEELLAQIEAFFHECAVIQREGYRYHTLRLDGTDLTLDRFDVCHDLGEMKTFCPPEILTIDEWFGQHANRRFNDDER